MTETAWKSPYVPREHVVLAITAAGFPPYPDLINIAYTAVTHYRRIVHGGEAGGSSEVARALVIQLPQYVCFGDKGEVSVGDAIDHLRLEALL